MKLTDLKDLRVIKKNLEPEPEPKPQQNQPRKRSVELRSKEEEHARNEGLLKGQKVRMMDTNDTATLVGFGKDFYELELDGLIIRAVRSEFIPIDAEEDRRPPQRARRSLLPLLHLHLQHPRYHQRHHSINRNCNVCFRSNLILSGISIIS